MEIELILGLAFVAGIVTYIVVSRNKRKKAEGDAANIRPGVRPPTKLD